MGGSVVTRTCPLLLSKGYSVSGVAVLDVVEGSAMDALPHMHSLLNARPDGFDTIEQAVEWQYVIYCFSVATSKDGTSVSTNVIRNSNSARVSIPSIFTPSNSTSPLVHAQIWRTPLRSTAPYWPSTAPSC
jgi:protein phosphatase methylesterase 1